MNWDDDVNLLTNFHYRGLGWTQLRWMFTTFYQGHYQPLSWVTLGLDYLLWGMEPVGYHLTSLLLHAANAVLFYFVSLRLLSLALSIPAVPEVLAVRAAAGFAALFFAIHPLRVESVVWATERRDILSSLFFLATVLCYLRATTIVAADSTWRRWMGAAVIVYGLSLLSKASGMTLPVVLLVLDVYPLGRLGGGRDKWLGPTVRSVWWEKIPFLLLALGAGTVAVAAQRQSGALVSFHAYSVIRRVGQALYGLAFYLWKTVVPFGLSPLYQVPIRLDPWVWPFILSGLAVLVISIVLFIARRRWPAALASWICYVAILAPVLGIAQSGVQLVADRYSYLSCLGWAILAGGGVLYFWPRWLDGHPGRRIFFLAPGVAAVVLVGLGVLTWKQAEVWHDSERLWRHALAITESGLGYNNLGMVLFDQGKLEEALRHFRKSLQMNPDYSEAHYNLATALTKQGHLEEAIAHFRRGLEVNPDDAKAHYNLANNLAERGEVGEAVQHYRQAVRLNPEYVEAYSNLGIVLATQGDLKGAIKQFREALKLNPALSNTRFNLALAFLKGGLLKEAKDEFDQLLKAQPELVVARYYLGNILVAQGDLDKGTDELKEAVRLQPDFADAHVTLARVLALQGKREEAIRHYQEALRILKARRPPPARAR